MSSRTSTQGGRLERLQFGFRRTFWLITLLAPIPGPGVWAQSPPTSDLVELFEKEVRPILAENCYSCHGPQLQMSSLRLDSRADNLCPARFHRFRQPLNLFGSIKQEGHPLLIEKGEKYRSGAVLPHLDPFQKANEEGWEWARCRCQKFGIHRFSRMLGYAPASPPGLPLARQQWPSRGRCGARPPQSLSLAEGPVSAG